MVKPLALITGAGTYVGPALARRMATAGFDLVLTGATAGLVQELQAQDIEVTALADGLDGSADGWQVIAEHLRAPGRLQAAALFPPCPGHLGYCHGPLLQASGEQLTSLGAYLETTLLALQSVVPILQANRGGQVVVFTSDAGVRPVANWSVYGAIRAAQAFLVQAAAAEHAADQICLNVIGSKNALFAGFPGAPAAAISDSGVVPGAWAESLLQETPLGRLGTMQELANFAGVLLDGSSRFQTGQYFSFSGGWQAGW